MKMFLRVLALIVSSPIWLSVAAFLVILFVVIGIPVLFFTSLLCAMEFAITGKWTSPWEMLNN